jgi:thiol-disulfide isomerase/thioredoxin
MKKLITIAFFLCVLQSNAQEPLLTTGSVFPDMVINHISNAPVKEFYLGKAKDNKFYILNFWGTWCSPCIPEMDSLAKLQKQFGANVQVIAISDDNEARKKKYLQNKPSAIWLATDTSYTLYNMLGLAFVGQSIIVNPAKRIVAMVRTDSINAQLLNTILKGDTVKMSAGIKETLIPAGSDEFAVDSLMEHSFTIRGYKKGQRSMGKLYWDNPVYGNRRASWFNVSAGLLYRSAYGIKSYGKQEFYEGAVTEADLNSHDGNNKRDLYCVDLLVPPGKEDSLYIILRQYLNDHLPVQARPEKKTIPVYVFKRKSGAPLAITTSSAVTGSMSFSGRGYNGTKVLVKDFAADYLSNELGLPVIDETGLAGFFDIKTTVEQRDFAGILKSIEALGLVVEKAEREMPVIIYYKKPTYY